MQKFVRIFVIVKGNFCQFRNRHSPKVHLKLQRLPHYVVGGVQRHRTVVRKMSRPGALLVIPKTA